MNKIHTPGTNPQEETTTPKQEVVTDNTGASLEKSLSEVPLTPDQRIDQLTAEVRNLTNGLNQLLELSKILIKGQIESRDSLENKLQTIIKSQIGMDTFLGAEKHNTQVKDVIRQLREFVLPKGDHLYESRQIVIEKKDVNAPAPNGWTLLENAVSSNAIALVELLLSSPDIHVDERTIKRGGLSQAKNLLASYLSQQKK